MNEGLRLGFRVDAGDTIGTGHVMEMISLIRGLRTRLAFEPVVLTAPNEFAVSKFREAGVDQIHLLASGPEEKEVAEILAVLEGQGVRHLVLDLPHRSDYFYARLHSQLARTCVVLDDSDHRELAATVVVNFSITQDPAWYERASRFETRYLIGPKYFPWDDAIQEAKRGNLPPEVTTILINQGGSDPFGLTVKILHAMEQSNLPQKFFFVLGGHVQAQQRSELAQMRPDLQLQAEFFDNLPRSEFYRLMQASDLAISAAGNTLYELLYIGVPTLVISHHRLHDEVARAFEHRGALVNLGMGDRLAPGRLVEELREIAADYPRRLSLQRHGQDIFGRNHGCALVDELVRLYS